VRDVVAQVAAGRDEVRRFVADTLDRLDVLCGELEQRHQITAAERSRLDEQSRQLATEVERQRAAVAAERERVREEVHREVSAAMAGLAEVIAQQRQQLAHERAQWQEELKRLRELVERRDQRPKSS